MTSDEIPYQRLQTQHITGDRLETPEDVVQQLGAVQAQDYLAARWALGLRCRGVDDAAVAQALDAGRILRTHVMRPTWHFVAPADIRWLLALTAPRVHAMNAYQYRQLGLDATIRARAADLIAAALEGGRQQTRAELAAVLEQAGINTAGTVRLSCLMMHAELEGVICSGAWRGKQLTYALLAERAPGARLLPREEALAELTRRYFSGHGPATVKDYGWWSGLAAVDTRAGIEMVKAGLIEETIDGQTYWRADSPPVVRDLSPTAYLLPNYDEYTIGYEGHDAILVAAHAAGQNPGAQIYFGHIVVIDGQVRGAWKRTFAKGAVHLAIRPFTPFMPAEQEAIAAAAGRYGAFLGLRVVLTGEESR